MLNGDAVAGDGEATNLGWFTASTGETDDLENGSLITFLGRPAKSSSYNSQLTAAVDRSERLAATSVGWTEVRRRDESIRVTGGCRSFLPATDVD